MKKNMLNMTPEEIYKLQEKEYMNQDVDSIDRERYNVIICALFLIVNLVGILGTVLLCNIGYADIFDGISGVPGIVAFVLMGICFYIGYHTPNSIVGITNLVVMVISEYYMLIPFMALVICDLSSANTINNIFEVSSLCEFAVLLTILVTIIGLFGYLYPDWYADTAKLLFAIILAVGICLLISSIFGFYHNFLTYVFLVIYASLLTNVLHRGHETASNLYNAVGWVTACHFFIAVLIFARVMASIFPVSRYGPIPIRFPQELIGH